MNERGRQDRGAGLERRVAEHVLQELLADEHRAHERAEHDDARARRDPEDAARRRRRGRRAGSCARRCRRKKATPAASAIAARPSTSAPSFGTGAKLIARISAPTSTTDRMPPRLSTGSVVSLTWRGHEQQRHDERDDRERQRDQEDRAPPEVLEQRAREQRAERRDRAAERRPERDRLRPRRPGPERGDQRQRRRVRHAGREPAADARGERALRPTGAYAASSDSGHRQRRAER